MQRSLVLLLLLSLGESWAVKQVAHIFDRMNQDPNGDMSVRTEYCPDFKNCDPDINDNAISSTLATGVWIFYSGHHYNYDNLGDVEWVFGDEARLNFGIVGDKVSSLRYAGDSDDWKRNTITLYEFEHFSGLEYYETKDVPEVYVMKTVKSVIITGRAEWTVYPSANFRGNGVCFGAQTGKYAAFAPDLDTYPINTIKSFRMGCYAKNKIQLDSSEHGVFVKTKG
ncbi:unnamed protein product [Darwinula stevensoni]|uniref:Beta/gamma crystallin 'Greek key' domain-containing protein n=1 Tax=Darwinula stevensoni TaxID=69355 RepID=A0A7R8X6H6_9CRUS|nr:unnamed protein product [Darwinula stevensoni]CAG0886906.1 unnamed protein product [Darwinula stevensoni]